MKILAIADRAPKQPIMQLLQNNPDTELIVCLGDLDYFSLSELEDVTHIPKIGVYGNHCSGTYFEQLGILNMHLATFTYQGISFGGFEGCVRYKDDPYAKMYTQDEASALLNGFPKVDVFLSHCPPFGINDESEISHQGFIALRNYIEHNSPRYLLHGHTYPTEQNLITRYQSTEIVYVSGERIVVT